MTQQLDDEWLTCVPTASPSTFLTTSCSLSMNVICLYVCGQSALSLCHCWTAAGFSWNQAVTAPNYSNKDDRTKGWFTQITKNVFYWHLPLMLSVYADLFYYLFHSLMYLSESTASNTIQR